MKIEQAYDNVVLTHDDIQEALKTAVMKKSGRTVRGDVQVEYTRASELPGQPYTLRVRTSGFCYLEPVSMRGDCIVADKIVSSIVAGNLTDAG